MQLYSSEQRAGEIADSGPLRPLTEAGITFFTGVPDSEFNKLIEELERPENVVSYALAAREDGAIGLAAGAALAGEQPLVFMESAGLGNSFDVLTSLLIAYRIPLVILVAWAGYEERDTPHHNAMGLRLEALVSALRVPVAQLADFDDSPSELGALVETIRESANNRGLPGIVLGIPSQFAAEAGRDAG